MRAWRKLESSIITSDRLSKVSDSAKWLFALLVVAQDDEGKYPWTKPRRQALIAGTEWDIAHTDSLLSELSQSAIIELYGGFIYLKNGVEKNGTPANSAKYPVIYPPLSELGTESPTTEYSEVRVEKIRDKSKSREKNTRATVVDEDFIEQMVMKYVYLWPADDIREAIKDAQGHKAWGRWNNKQRYVDGWLRRNAERSNNGTARRGDEQASEVDPTWKFKEQTRRLAAGEKL